MPYKKRSHARLSAIGKTGRGAQAQKRHEIELKKQEKLQWQEKQESNKSSMTFMATKNLQNILNHFVCPKCNEKGNLLVNQRSMQGVNTNLEVICSCGSKITSWTAENEFTDALLVSAKVNGITKTQLERFLLCLNFTAESETSATSICLTSNAMLKKSEEIRSKLIELSKKIEKAKLDTILEERPDVFIASEDGAYPNGIRTRNSGACFNTVMAYDKDNNAHIVCKYQIDKIFVFWIPNSKKVKYTFFEF